MFIERHAINLFSDIHTFGSDIIERFNKQIYSFRFIGINMKFVASKKKKFSHGYGYTQATKICIFEYEKIQLLKSLHPQNGNYSRGNPQWK